MLEMNPLLEEGFEEEMEPAQDTAEEQPAKDAAEDDKYTIDDFR